MNKNINIITMIIVKVNYTVKPAFVQKNQENISLALDEIRRLNNPGIRYTVLLGEDGKTFTHLSLYDNEQSQKALLGLESFKAFQKQRDESGLEAAPEIEYMTLVS